MLMHNSIEHSDSYSKVSGSLWQYYRNEIFLDDDNTIANFPAANINSVLLIFTQKIKKRWYKRCSNNGAMKII